MSLATVRDSLTEVEKCKKSDVVFREYLRLRNERRSVFDGQEKGRFFHSMDAAFGMWLRITAERDMTTEKLEAHFKDFAVKNPYDLVAMEKLREAANADDLFCASAFYKQGCEKVIAYKNNKVPQELADAKELFKRAHDLLTKKNKRHIFIMGIVSATSARDPAMSAEPRDPAMSAEAEPTALLTQMRRMMTLTTAILRNIETLIGRSLQADIDGLTSAIDNTENEEEKKQLIKQKEELISKRTAIERGLLDKLKEEKRSINYQYIKLSAALPNSEEVKEYQEELAQFADEHMVGLV